jgi:predicted small lipoprotein YifL
MLKSLAPLWITLSLTACGQTGPLYLPDHGKPPHKNRATPAAVVPIMPATPKKTEAESVPDQNPTPTPTPTPDAAQTPGSR